MFYHVSAERGQSFQIVRQALVQDEQLPQTDAAQQSSRTGLVLTASFFIFQESRSGPKAGKDSGV